MIKKINHLFIIALLFVSGFYFGQTPDPFYSHIFDPDSLEGFGEEAARRSAISEQFLGAEFKVRMYQLKRNYIDEKFGLRKNQLNYIPTEAKVTVQAGCLNEDFEASAPGVITTTNQILGWTITGGYNNSISSSNTTSLITYYPGGLSGIINSCNLLGCCPMPPIYSELIDCSAPGGYISGAIGAQYPIYSVFGSGSPNAAAAAANPQISGGMFGNKVLMLNNELTSDWTMQKLSKTFSITPLNALFQFAFISVFYSGHACCDAGAFQVKLLNATTNTVIACPAFSVSAPSPQCTGTLPYSYYLQNTGALYNPATSTGQIYNPWKVNSMDLTQYIGQNITIEIVASDCNAGGHFGCVYFDTQCRPITMNLNGVDSLATDSAINFVSCEPTATLTAPQGYFSYNWIGPVSFTSTNSAITASLSGTYTIMLGSGFSCTAFTKKIIHLTISQDTGSIISSANPTCLGDLPILTALGINNCAWSDGSTTPSIFISPTITTTYSVNGINLDGCPVSAMLVQNVLGDCTGINLLNSNKKGVYIYPNPNNGEFTLNVEKDIHKAEILVENELGQVLYKQSIYKGKTTIKVKGLANGIYYYSILENKQTVSKGKFEVE